MTIDSANERGRLMFRAGLEVAGAAAFIGAGFLAGPIWGLTVTGAVCWFVAAFGDWSSRGDNQQPANDDHRAELPEE